MQFLIGMPGGSEWIVILIAIPVFFLMPILTVVFYLRYRSLKKEVQTLQAEKKLLLDKLLGD